MSSEVVVSVVSKIGEFLIGQIGRQLEYLIHYKSNIENLMKQVEKLKDKRDVLQRVVHAAIRNGDIIGRDVQRWLGSVDELCANATTFYDGEVKENNGCLKGWLPNLKTCYTLSKKAKKKTEEAVKLQKEGLLLNRISTPAPPLALGFTSMRDFKSFESRETTIKDIVNLLIGDNVSMIGICGMGGVGKTTMVKEIARRVRDENLFDEIVVAVVSQSRDSMKIQDEIADHLGLKFEEKSNLDVRAGHLLQRLVQSSKGNIVILDDMWESFDLREIGIPYEGEHKRSKIVLTSRSVDVCKEMGCGKIFKIEVLSEQEAWSLFREMAGDSVNAPDLYRTASNVAKECGGLPISVVTVGKALNDKSKEEWDDALKQLRKSIVPTTLSGVEAKVYQSLWLSYDHLESKEAKSLFLLCCFFPEDKNIPLEYLVRYGVGLRLFEEIDLLTDARDRVHALIMKLKRCFLLLDGNKRFYVKLHDVVRDVGISIGSKDNHFNMMMIHGRGWPKVRDYAYKDCNALSVLSNTISDLPSGGLDCPNIEVLQLACKNLSLKALNRRNVFGGMPRLRVLDMYGMSIRSLPSSIRLLTNLRALCLNGRNWFGEIFEIPKELGNLEILSIKDAVIREFPKDIGRLTNLRLLDMRGHWIKKIPPSVFSCLHLLEDLHTGYWQPAKEGNERGNASFNDLQSLSYLTSLVIGVPDARFLPKNPFLEKLKRYMIVVGYLFPSKNISREILRAAKIYEKRIYDFSVRNRYNSANHFLEKLLLLSAHCIDDAILGGGIDRLLKQSTETLVLRGAGLKTVLDKLFPGGSIYLRELCIHSCKEKVKYLVDTGNAELVPPNIGVFGKLEKLILTDVTHLKELCHGQQLPVGSFGCLQKMNLSYLPALTHLWDYENQSVKLSNLRFVCVSQCNKLENLFTLSVARSLVNIESLEITLNEKMEEVICNQGPSGTTKADGVELADIHKTECPKLIKMSLYKLGSLTCFSKGNDQINLPQLNDLNIQYLPKLLSFCPEGNRNVALEDSDTVHSQSLFNHKVKLTNLKNLVLKWLDDMTEIWNDQLDGDSFHELKKVEIEECNRISTVLQCNMTQGFRNLEVMYVRYCKLVEGVFEYGELNNANEEGHSAVVLLPCLKGLHLHDLPKLTQIWKKHLRMNHDFRELCFIHIDKCHSMKLVFSASIAKVLVKLQTLSVKECDMMEQIVANDHPEGEGSELSEMEFQNLRSLSLESLHNLMSVCSGRLYFPSLVEIKFDSCSKMKTISSSSFLNSAINTEPLFSNQVTFPILEKLQLNGLRNFEELWCSQIPTGSFQKVRVLKVGHCDKLVNLLPSHLLKVFSSLEELEVYYCNSLEELFDSKGVSIEGGYHATLLKSIKVVWCDHIRNLFPSSTARGLLHLERLEVNSCQMIEEIFTEKTVEDGRKDKTLFPALEVLKLIELPRLKSFCNVNYTIELPVLKEVQISCCSEMTTFSSSFVSTPKLDSVRDRRGKKMWKGNLNETIKHLNL